MASASYRLPPADRRIALLAGIAAIVLTVGLVTWAKWWPYVFKTLDIAATSDVGAPILSGAGAQTGDSVWATGLSFSITYIIAIWKAMLAGLLIAAAVESLVPRRWLLRMVGDGRRPYRSTLAGAVMGLPTMMCTCCAVPVAASLRRSGAPTGAAIGFWVANPMLNPAVLVFSLLVLPWQWTTVRFAAGAAIVVFVAWYFAAPARSAHSGWAGEDDQSWTVAETVRRFARSTGRLALVLIPEYLLVIYAVGVFQAWVSPADWGDWVVLATILAAVIGALLVIPTAGEIPIAQGLHQAGAGLGVIGALLATLPALSLPALIMLRRTVPARQLAALTAAVMAIGLAAGTALVLLA